MRNPSILVVDDDPIQHTLISGVLSSHFDVEVVTVRSGREAVRLIQEGTIDVSLILVDVYMPDFDGAEVVRELATLDCSAGLVIMSVNERVLPLVQAMAEGYGLNVLGAVAKPFQQDDFELIGGWHQQTVQGLEPREIDHRGKRSALQRFGSARRRRFGCAVEERGQAS